MGRLIFVEPACFDRDIIVATSVRCMCVVCVCIRCRCACIRPDLYIYASFQNNLAQLLSLGTRSAI